MEMNLFHMCAECDATWLWDLGSHLQDPEPLEKKWLCHDPMDLSCKTPGWCELWLPSGQAGYQGHWGRASCEQNEMARPCRAQHRMDSQSESVRSWRRMPQAGQSWPGMSWWSVAAWPSITWHGTNWPRRPPSMERTSATTTGQPGRTLC